MLGNVDTLQLTIDDLASAQKALKAAANNENALADSEAESDEPTPSRKRKRRRNTFYDSIGNAPCFHFLFYLYIGPNVFSPHKLTFNTSFLT